MVVLVSRPRRRREAREPGLNGVPCAFPAIFRPNARRYSTAVPVWFTPYSARQARGDSADQPEPSASFVRAVTSASTARTASGGTSTTSCANGRTALFSSSVRLSRVITFLPMDSSGISTTPFCFTRSAQRLVFGSTQARTKPLAGSSVTGINPCTSGASFSSAIEPSPSLISGISTSPEVVTRRAQRRVFGSIQARETP